MKSKYLVLIILSLAVLICVLMLTVKFSDIDISMPIKKYHTCTADGREFRFYGSFGKVSNVKVYEDGDKLCELNLDADASIFSDDVSDAVALCDINADGENDIVVLCAVDEDGDRHRRLFIRETEGYSAVHDTDISNFRSDDGMLISESQDKRYLAKPVKEYEVPYEKYSERNEYGYFDGEIKLARRIKVSYFSESDIYCFGIWEYDKDIEQLICLDEDWLSADEYSEKYNEIQKLFEIPVPQIN